MAEQGGWNSPDAMAGLFGPRTAANRKNMIRCRSFSYIPTKTKIFPIRARREVWGAVVVVDAGPVRRWTNGDPTGMHLIATCSRHEVAGEGVVPQEQTAGDAVAATMSDFGRGQAMFPTGAQGRI